jgi:polyhydroxybutyrate depolymerase
MKHLLRFLLGLLLLPMSIQAQTSVYSIQHGGYTRSYRLHLPTGYTGSSPVPLVFNLHGYTSNAFQQEVYSNMNAVADTAGFIVCYPDGINNAWNSGFSLPYGGGVNDVGLISTLIDEIASQYNINLARVYSCGMSNGGFMSYRLACDLDDRIAAVASVTGAMTTIQTTNCNASRPVPVFEIHGTADGTVPYNGSSINHSIDSVLNFWRNRNTCTGPTLLDTLPDIAAEGSTVSSQWNNSCAANTEVLHYKIENGGHTWPGAIPLSGQNTNQDIKASVEIWHFFNRQVHPSPTPLAVSDAMSQTRLQAYPNPSNGELRISGGQPGQSLLLLDAQGKTLRSWTLTEAETQLDLGDLPGGIYLLKQADAGGQGAAIRIALQR